MCNAKGLDLKSYDTVSLLTLGVVVLQNNVDMIEDECFLCFLVEESDGEPPRIVRLSLPRSGRANGSTRLVINDPVVMVAVLDVRRQHIRLDLAEGDLTEYLTVHLAEHVDRVRGILDFVPG